MEKLFETEQMNVAMIVLLTTLAFALLATLGMMLVAFSCGMFSDGDDGLWKRADGTTSDQPFVKNKRAFSITYFAVFGC